ncbi:MULTISPECIES: hypothetical protein [Streptomyces]|uniref:Uncharacterized protein n=1 Tax=Streptomyces dengpaensis TaxID=2049881 RepID=A0ABN5I4R3_9ACTN|nr:MULTISPECIES: hypothetical protein [Streptomyces]AVH57866.1 hypothetical protein C4B68_21225 [Streptomyces dengpaensis]PIB04837.1 hypothetical protein B1C81_31310 [Streptomyces sp. HG99]
MTPNEVQMLIVGAALGAQSMNLLHMYWGWRDGQRADAAARRQARILGADQFHSSLRLYRLQHGSPA